MSGARSRRLRLGAVGLLAWAMVAFVLPGMLGGALTTGLFGKVFANVPPGGAGSFGALMLLGYGAMLAAALAAGPRRSPGELMDGAGGDRCGWIAR